MEKEILIELILRERKSPYSDNRIYKFEPCLKELSVKNNQDFLKTFYYDWVCFYNKNNNASFTEGALTGFFIGANDISLEEVKIFVQEFFKGLTGGSMGEIGFKTSFFFNQYDQFASYWLGSGFADFEGVVHGKNPRETLKALKLVSAQKGNRFYHEDEVLDLASWQPENPNDFELYLCFHLVFEDETVLPVYRTWATHNRVIDSYNRYVSETKKRIFWMYPFTVPKAGYDLSYWDKFINEEVSLFPAKSKTESAIKQYMEYGFEPANYYEEYLTKKLSTLEDTYVFKGRVEIIEEIID
jgi:hypothetical protein